MGDALRQGQNRARSRGIFLSNCRSGHHRWKYQDNCEKTFHFSLILFRIEPIFTESLKKLVDGACQMSDAVTNVGSASKRPQHRRAITTPDVRWGNSAILLGSKRRCGAPCRDEDAHPQADEFPCERGQLVITTFRPAKRYHQILSFDKPGFPSPRRKAATTPVDSFGDRPLTNPITGIAGCCARASASGHATAPPTSVMNSRRLIVGPRGQNHAPHRLTAVRVLERGERGANCDQLFWAGNVGFESHDRGQNRKSSVSANAFPVCPRQRTNLPILELLPPPALGERRHRGLARRLVAVRRRAVLMLAESERPHPRRPYRGRMYLHDTADDSAMGEHVEIVVVPLAGRAASRRALDCQRARASVTLTCLAWTTGVMERDPEH